MTPTLSAAALFASTFVLVFSLGLQSQFVNGGHFVSAFVNSLAIGGANLVLFKLAPDASGAEIVGYLSGGPFGIVASMYAFRKWKGKTP
jgi:predicted permease